MRRKIWLTSLVNRLAVDSSNYQILLVCLEAEVFNDQGLVNSLKTNRQLHWKPGASKNRVQAQSLEAQGLQRIGPGEVTWGQGNPHKGPGGVTWGQGPRDCRPGGAYLMMTGGLTRGLGPSWCPGRGAGWPVASRPASGPSPTADRTSCAASPTGWGTSATQQKMTTVLP